MKRAWTNEELIRLKDLPSNHTIAELAQILNRTPDSVRDKLRKLGLKTKGNKTRSDEERHALIKSIKQLGVSHLAATSNLSYDTLYGIYRSHKNKEHKRLSSFSQKRLQALRQKALSYASGRGIRPEMAQEFASHLMLKFVEGGGKFIRPDWTYSQWLRDELNIDYTKDNELTQVSSTANKIKSTYLQITGVDSDDSDDSIDSVVPASSENPISILDVLSELEHIDSIDRACFILSIHFGLTHKEIAMCFGVSEQRIDQRVKRALEYMRPR